METVIAALLEAGEVPEYERVKAPGHAYAEDPGSAGARGSAPDLAVYDALIEREEVAV